MVQKRGLLRLFGRCLNAVAATFQPTWSWAFPEVSGAGRVLDSRSESNQHFFPAGWQGPPHQVFQNIHSISVLSFHFLFHRK